MRSAVLRSLVIAIVMGVVLTGGSTIVMATYHQSSESLGVGRVLTGLEAVSAAIGAFGMAGFLKGLVGTFLLFFLGVFLGALWQAIWMLSKSGASGGSYWIEGD